MPKGFNLLFSNIYNAARALGAEHSDNFQADSNLSTKQKITVILMIDFLNSNCFVEKKIKVIAKERLRQS